MINIDAEPQFITFVHQLVLSVFRLFSQFSFLFGQLIPLTAQREGKYVIKARKTPTGSAPTNMGTSMGFRALIGASSKNPIVICGVSALVSCPSKYNPSRCVDSQIKGKLIGLPTHVPMVDAMIFPPKINAKMPAVMKCVPTSGLAEAKAPHAMPKAIFWGPSSNRMRR